MARNLDTGPRDLAPKHAFVTVTNPCVHFRVGTAFGSEPNTGPEALERVMALVREHGASTIEVREDYRR